MSRKKGGLRHEEATPNVAANGRRSPEQQNFRVIWRQSYDSKLEFPDLSSQS